jgi:hypothetical protein
MNLMADLIAKVHSSLETIIDSTNINHLIPSDLGISCLLLLFYDFDTQADHQKISARQDSHFHSTSSTNVIVIFVDLPILEIIQTS